MDVASASSFNFFRLIFRWKGSIWKLCLKELCIWTLVFLIVTFIYRSSFFLTYSQKVIFEKLANYFDTHLNYIPLTFMLGFFVQTVVKRWSVLFENMGYIESTSMYIGGYVNGIDDESRLLRRTMARYLCLTQLLIYRDISIRVRKRFPTYDSIIKTGFMSENEYEILKSTQPDFDKYWVPINWIYALIFRGRKSGKIISDAIACKLCDEVRSFRHHLQILCNYNWVPIPLAYPQIDLLLPCVTMMEFIIFVGWMKVAEGLLNPFGEDDDDFESNFLIDKNLAVSLCIVDDASNDAPEMEKDRFWSNSKINEIYSKKSLIV
uniref:Bestrophin homolog n=1 Tax=Brugia malayi TaxID=6279 RepID=A0A5S6PHY5_BRUMA